MAQRLVIAPMHDPTECVPGSILFYGGDRLKYMRHFSERIRAATAWETSFRVRRSVDMGNDNCRDTEPNISEEELRLSINAACDAVDQDLSLCTGRGRCVSIADDDGELWDDPLFEYAMQNGSKSDMALLIASSYPPPNCDLRPSDRTRCVLLCGPFGGDCWARWRDFWHTFLWMVSFDDFVIKVGSSIFRVGSAILIDYSEMCPSSGEFVVHSIKI